MTDIYLYSLFIKKRKKKRSQQKKNVYMGYEGLVSQSESEKKQIFFTVKKNTKKLISLIFY